MESVARINRLFGVDGEVMITLYPTLPSSFEMAKDPLFAKIDGLYVPLYLDKFERRGRAGAVVAFADIDTERRVSELLNTELYLPESEEEQITTEDEFTLEDLIGFAVEARVGNTGGYYEGEVSEFYDGRNPLFGLLIDGREVLIPAVEEFIAGIDFERRHIIFILPEGLIEL